MALTAKQRAFVNEYVQDFNATRAALDAGYSQKTAYSIGNENLKKPEIAEAIDELIQHRVMSRNEALMRLADIARFDVSDYIVDYGRTKSVDVEKMKADGYGHLIRAVKHTNSGTTIEWADPSSALSLVLKETHPTGHEDDPQHLNIVIKYADTDADPS
jgi:phage terminase small subunit